MPATMTAADIVKRDRHAMVSTMAALVSIGDSVRAEAMRPDQIVARAVPMLRQSARTTQAAHTIRDLLLASGVTHDEIMMIAEGLDREAAMLATLEG